MEVVYPVDQDVSHGEGEVVIGIWKTGVGSVVDMESSGVYEQGKPIFARNEFR